MINEDFVTFELAKKLKEKGFNWICSHYYRTKCKDLFMVFPCEDWSYIEDRVNAPTISQVLKWLRKEKGIYVALDFFRFNGNTELWWTYSIRYIEDDSTEDIVESCKRKSWEQAALAGIEYALDNLIMGENFEEKVINEMVDVLRNDKNFQEFSKQTMNKIILGEL